MLPRLHTYRHYVDILDILDILDIVDTVDILDMWGAARFLNSWALPVTPCPPFVRKWFKWISYVCWAGLGWAGLGWARPRARFPLI